MTRIQLLPLLLVLVALLGCSCGGAGEIQTTDPAGSDALPSVSLPPLATLDSLATDSLRSVSADRLQLLETPYLLASDSGVQQLPGFIGLDISASPTAWVLYRAPGLDPEGSVVPTGMTTTFNKPLYVALADFSSGRWQWIKRNSIGTLPIANGADLVSPGGNVYFVALAWQQSTDISSLELLFSGEVPASPNGVVNVPASIVTGYELEYDAIGSTAGSGAVITGVSYDFGDGSGTTLGVATDIPVTHTYVTPGTYTVTVRIDNDLGYSDYGSVEVNVSGGITDLLVVANSDRLESIELADYYMSPVTGRGIATTHRFELALGADPAPAIDRQDYEGTIRNPLKDFLDASPFKQSLKYILLLDGIPHQIPGESGGDINLSSFSSVDSELCTLYSDDTYLYASYLWNEEEYQNFRQSGANDGSFYIGLADLDTEYSFSHGQYKVTNNAGTQYDLDYLVGRLDAYDLADAKALVDRSMAADTSGNGWVIYDTTPARFDLDTMSDPVWPTVNDNALSGAEEMAVAGQNYHIDLTTTRIIGQESDGLPVGAVDNVIAYAGRGVNHSGGSWPSGNTYILDDLLFNWLPGAAWISYESFNGTDFDSATVDGDRSDINRKGQGQICDFLHTGGTVAMGHVYEPWTIAVGDERAVHYRYVVKGDRWIEAAYKGLRTLSWMDVVVGDPLCRVR